ncbi:MAG: RidA family protein [Ignavibacteria bacterium]|nr:RidA family protein [Ignavibacteria bacterium]
MSNSKEQPVPQGKYLSAIRHADLIYVSGMTPRKNGQLIYSGKIKTKEPVESNKDAVRLAALNALTAAQSCLSDGESISIILQLNVFLNAEEDFTAHAKVADYASELLIEYLGSNCIGSRAAIGVASLPSNAPIEIAIIGKVV